MKIQQIYQHITSLVMGSLTKSIFFFLPSKVLLNFICNKLLEGVIILEAGLYLITGREWETYIYLSFRAEIHPSFYFDSGEFSFSLFFWLFVCLTQPSSIQPWNLPQGKWSLMTIVSNCFIHAAHSFFFPVFIFFCTRVLRTSACKLPCNH